MYNPQDTVENNLIKGIGHYVPDDMDEVQTMRFQVMSVLTACPIHVSSDFRNSNGVKRWTRCLKGKGNDKQHCDFMVSKFQCHMEDGLFHTPVTDIQDIGDHKINSTPNHLHLLTYAIYIRRTRLDITNPGVIVPR